MAPNRHSAELRPWGDVKAKLGNYSILIGNGASCAVWPNFGYHSLYEEAITNRIFADDDRRLFNAIETESYENVLSSLATTIKVLSAMNMDVTHIQERYTSIQNALATSIRNRHIPWPSAREVFPKVYNELRSAKAVYSTNYDLLIYWSIMEGGDHSVFKDYFWGAENQFDLKNTGISNNGIPIYYLHGGLFLESLDSGYDRKRVNIGNESLLEQFGISNNVPLIVTEGTSQQKMKSISSSPYLSFAYEQFAKDRKPLVVLGHSLSQNDSHLISALKDNRRRMAISIYSIPGADNESIINGYNRNLTPLTPEFFSAQTHPLCSPDMNRAIVTAI